MFLLALTEWLHGFCTLYSLHPHPAQAACDTFKNTHIDFKIKEHNLKKKVKMELKKFTMNKTYLFSSTIP